MKMQIQKPKCRLVGEDGNAFAIMARVSQALRGAGQGNLVSKYLKEATQGDYDHLLRTSMEYVDDVGCEDEEYD